MRIAIVADIHANMHALTVFLDYIADMNVDRILNVGDFVQIGPHPDAVSDIVLQDERFINVLGNNELALLNRKPHEFRESEVEHQDWTISRLGSQRLARIAEVPHLRRLSFGSTEVLMTHVPEAELCDPSRPAITLCGHTHRSGFSRDPWCGRTEVNPGSIGCAPNFRASFAIAEINGGPFSVSFHEIPYDSGKLIDDFHKLDVPDSDWILSHLYRVPSVAG